MAYTFDEDDISKIEQAQNEGGKIWDNECLSSFKKKFKTYLLDADGGGNCCYCRKNFKGEFYMVIDIEHVLPKSDFDKYIFSIFNLNTSCKRCNMNIKKEDVSFVVNLVLAKLNPEDPSLYRFVHPNLDNYSEHLGLISIMVDHKKLVKYQPHTQKGNYTYSYFKLRNLEIDSFNEAQGISPTHGLSDLIPSNIKDKLEELLKIL